MKGCEGYPKPFRELAVTLLAHGQQQHLPCHPSTVYRWRGDISRKAKTGGQKAWVLRGEHELLLCFYRMVYPKAQAAEIIAFIARESSDGALFTPSQVSRREKELGYTRKRGSTLANQALTPANIQKHQFYWSLPYPGGVVGIPRIQLIDIDEFGIWIEKANRVYGKVLVGRDLRENGKYGHGQKWTCKIGVKPGGQRWFEMSRDAGTTVESFDSFVFSIVSTLPAAPQCTLLWDNLRSHHSVEVANTVRVSGHRILARPPYRPADGPVEYVIHTVEAELSNRIHHVSNDQDLYNEVHSIVTGLAQWREFRPLFCPLRLYVERNPTATPPGRHVKARARTTARRVGEGGVGAYV